MFFLRKVSQAGRTLDRDGLIKVGHRVGDAASDTQTPTLLRIFVLLGKLYMKEQRQA